jgi:nucleoside-diphosphate-sugar epimerase
MSAHFEPRNLSLALLAGVGLAYISQKIAHKLFRDQSKRKRKFVITGGCGNLGSKLATYLVLFHSGEVDVVLIEHPLFVRKERIPDGISMLVEIDLENPSSLERVRQIFQDADAVVHFSAVNPYPNATWGDSASSMDHSFTVLLAAALEGVPRVVMASSSHVMGGYKNNLGVTNLTADMPVSVGTQVVSAAISGDAVAYGASKLAAERLCLSLGNAYRDTLFVVLRIGWCQPGDNHPSTLSAMGSPPEFLRSCSAEGIFDDLPPATEQEIAAAASFRSTQSMDERFFKNMVRSFAQDPNQRS